MAVERAIGICVNDEGRVGLNSKRREHAVGDCETPCRRFRGATHSLDDPPVVAAKVDRHHDVVRVDMRKGLLGCNLVPVDQHHPGAKGVEVTAELQRHSPRRVTRNHEDSTSERRQPGNGEGEDCAVRSPNGAFDIRHFDFDMPSKRR